MPAFRLSLTVCRAAPPKWAKARGHTHLRVDGEFVKRDWQLVGVDVERVLKLAEDTRDHIFAAADVPVGRNWIPGAYVPR